MKLSLYTWLSIAIVVGMFALAGWYGPGLPDPVPSHWNFAGEADGFMSKPWGIWMLPTIAAGIVAALTLLPLVAPKGFRLDGARRSWDLVIFVIVAFLGLLTLVVFRNAVGQGPAMNVAMPILIGSLFIVLGNYLTKFPKNFFIGIRTPWTLASDQVWYKTHRVGRWAFLSGGVLVIVGGVAGLGAWPLIAAVVLITAVPVLYSLFLYKRMEGFEEDDSGPG